MQYSPGTVHSTPSIGYNCFTTTTQCTVLYGALAEMR